MLVPKGLSFFGPKTVAFDFRKYFSGEELSKKMADVFSEVGDRRIQGKVKITMTDTLMSAFAN
jgi:hypothetical protein